MRIVRVEYNGDVFFGAISDDNLSVRRITNDIFIGTPTFGDEYEVKKVSFLPVVMPSKIVCIGKNYSAHAKEMNEGEPEEPLIFLKPNSCIVADGDGVVYPSISHRLDYEGELGVVIGKKCRYVSQADALDMVYGYTCLNDVTARDIQKGDMQWTRGKSFDTFCPIGPWIETDFVPNNQRISTKLNDKTVQDSVISNMTHKVPKLIEYISRVMTLYPGDIIATGTPEGIGPMQVGDVVQVTIEGIGTLTNTIMAE